MIKTGERLDATSSSLRDLALLSYRCNAVLKVIDPDFHSALLLVREFLRQKSPMKEAFNAIDPLLFEGREVLYNRKSALHVDSLDPQKGWGFFFAAGDFKGGYVNFPTMKLRVRLEPGDGILHRGRVIPHEIEDWEGNRISVPHFTHTSIWRAAGLEHLVSLQ